MEVFWIIFSAVLLAWGLIMLFSPNLFWKLASVDWNADVLAPRDRHHRHIVQVAGAVVALLSGSMLVGIVRSLLR